VEALRERFGKYHVLEKIAQGGMAEVYKVKTVGIAGFEKVQALKRILPQQAREGRFVRSFIDEARIAVELAHRNIVQVFDFGRADGELFLAMELIEGKDLRTALGEAVARNLLPSVPVAAYVIGEVAAGLDYAHRKTDGYGGSLGIVHCDVSPSNVMLSTDGYVKILDFGIARATFAAALERRRLRGKPRYMAPEQTFGEPPTTAADVFALGIIAWELFTGQPLYRGPDLKAILDAVRRTTPPRIDTINPQVPAQIVDAVETALAHEPGKRGTAADLAAACARTAMLASPRAVAEWLEQLAIDVDEPATIIAGPGAAEETGALQVPPPREPTVGLTEAGRAAPRDATQSLADGSASADLGEVFARGGLPRLPTEPMQRESSTALAVPSALRERDTAPAVTSFQPQSEPFERPSASLRDAARLGDAGPIERPSFAHMGFDEVTHQNIAIPGDEPPAPDASLASPAEDAAAAQALVAEPIDDELGPEDAPALAERRRTVVVAGLLSGAPPDELRAIAGALGALAYQRGGVVLAEDTEGLVVAFGLEVAGEDDVAIAMGWALDAIAVVRDTEDGEPVLRVGARAGVTTGSGTGAVPVDAVEEARALAKDAAPERPLFVGAAGRFTSNLYALREVPAPRRVARRSRVIEVTGPRGFDERDRARLARKGALFGRTAQLAELDVWFQRAIAADRRLTALITGVAGVGKSRLVAELIARRTEDVRVVVTGAAPPSRLAPFALVIDLYQAALGLPPGRGRSARAHTVHRLVQVMTKSGVPMTRARQVAVDLDRAMELRDGMGIGAPEVADLRPRISAGLAAFRAAMYGANRPGLTIIEDIHLADSASLEVLRHTLLVPAASPELLVLTARPEGPPAPAVDVVVSLGDLVGGELRALIADRLGDAATPFNIAAVLGRGGGNPLFIEELAQAVRDAGGTDDIPASARDVVSARIDRLSPTGKTALRLAAVLGGTVRVRLLEEVLGESPGTRGHTEDQELVLAELLDAGFLVRAEGAEGDLLFARGLVREVVYDSLSARAQRDAHARIGRLLASRYFAGREEPPAVIAEHLERGGELAGAAAFWLRAARLALTASDAAAAIACCSRVLAIERELGPVPPTPASKARRREALAGREEAHRLDGDLAADAGDLLELEKLCVGEPSRLADVCLRRAQRALRTGDYAAAFSATEAAEAHGRAAGDDRLRGEAMRVRGEVLERQGRFDEALAAVTAAGSLFASKGAVADEAAARIGRGRIFLLRARYEEAHEAYQPVNALIDRTGDPWLERIAKNHLAIIEMCLGNFDVAMASAMRSLELCRRYGDRAREGDALSVAGIILLEVGLWERAAGWFTEALGTLSRTASRWSRADCLIYAGTCEVRRGRGTGMQLIDEALAEARRLGARYLEANALVARAAAHLSLGAPGAAVTDAAEGTAVARAAGLVGYEIQGLSRLALALARQAARPGAVNQALALVDRAVALVDQQRHLEGSEEEVFAACIEVARLAGADETAAALRARGRAGAQRKLDRMADPEWRRAFAAIPEVAALLS
jgi:tetratricopeptide (TPR) repeat protein/tRNA A-37 threonylcarbamoyl transferase component Bud32